MSELTKRDSMPSSMLARSSARRDRMARRTADLLKKEAEAKKKADDAETLGRKLRKERQELEQEDLQRRRTIALSLASSCSQPTSESDAKKETERKLTARSQPAAGLAADPKGSVGRAAAHTPAVRESDEDQEAQHFWSTLNPACSSRDIHWGGDDEQLFEPITEHAAAPPMRKYTSRSGSARDPAKTAANVTRQNARRKAVKEAAKATVEGSKEVAKPAEAAGGRLLGAVADFWEKKKARASLS